MQLYKTIKSHRIHWQFQSSMFLVLCILVSNIWLIDTIFTMLIFHQGTVTPPEMGKLGPLILRCFHILYWSKQHSQNLRNVTVPGQNFNRNLSGWIYALTIWDVCDHRKESQNESLIAPLKSRWWLCEWVWCSYFSSHYYDMILVSSNFSKLTGSDMKYGGILFHNEPGRI